MADLEDLAKLRAGVTSFNEWGANLSHADLSGENLRNANLVLADLSRANLSDADLSGANLSAGTLLGADLRRADLTRADLEGANLSRAKLATTNLSQTCLLHANLSLADLREANLSHADLRRANLHGADLAGADLSGARLTGAQMFRAHLSQATLKRAGHWSDFDFDSWPGLNLTESDLSEADLRNVRFARATLVGANLIEADLRRANLKEADLSSAKVYKTNLAAANLVGANLDNSDLRCAQLQHAKLDRANLTGIRLWETQRAGWSIKGIICEYAYWDKEAKEQTAYAPGEFERLYSDQTCIELFYQGGVSTFELNTLPALLHHLASLHSGTNIRLKSIEETGGGAKISISVGDTDPETTEKIKADTMQVYQAQLTLRGKETERLQIERDYIERLFIGKLIPAMLTAAAPQNVFNAPVTGVVIASGESKVDFHQTVNDNSATLALLEKIMDRRADLGLSTPDATRFQSELQSATTELQKKDPDKSILSKSIGFIQKLATEAVTKAAGKLGESAVSDWQSWLHQLNQLTHHLK
ncbi:MAG: pentapeptide repeat-containing protein [Terracidiphilus sp.]|jgi:uncharacterized protein YjbI with pentapeptide repeats